MAKILVVDDDPAILLTAQLILKRDGHEVVTTSNAYAGLAQLEEGRFDLIIIDLFMPEMDGLEAINQVNLRYPQLRIVVASGYPFEQTVAQRPDFLATDIAAFISLKKPFRPADLREAVEKCLGSDSGVAAAGGSASW